MAEEERINAEAPKVMLMPTEEDNLDTELDQGVNLDKDAGEVSAQGGGQIVVDGETTQSNIALED